MANEEGRSLKKKLNEHLENTGSISSGDVAGYMAPDVEATAPVGEQMSEATVIGVDPVMKDTLNKAASGTDTPGEGLTETSDANAKSNIAGAITAGVIITPTDKELFVDAAISGDRMEAGFEILGGRIQGTIRNRTLPETRAIIARLAVEIKSGDIKTQLDYSVRLRSMLLAAQISEYNGVTYDTITSKGSLMPKLEGKEEVPPAWLDQADYWANLSEGPQAMIWDAVWGFENKYWHMVEQSHNQDFWQPEASTSE